jgi:CHAT domain-containing protein
MSVWIRCLAAALVTASAAAQQSTDSLRLVSGHDLRLPLRGGEKNNVTVAATSGDYVRIEVRADSDLAIKTTLYDPEGNLAAVTPGLGGTGGTARIAAYAAKSGAYRLQVQSAMFRPDPYVATVTLAVQRSATAQDRTDAEGHREFAKAAALANSGAAGMRQAITALDRPIQLAREAGDLVLEMRATFGVGQFHGTLAEQDGSLEGFQKAIPPFEHALELCRRFGDPRAESHVLSSLGQSYANLERNQEAVEWYRKALELQRATHQAWETALTLNNLAGAEASLGRLDLALEYLREQEILRRQLKDELGLNQMRVSMAETYLALGDFERALEALAATLPHWSALDDPQTEADAYAKLGLAYMSTGEYDSASAALQKAVTLGQKLHNAKTTASNLLLVAQLAALRRDSAGALKSYEVALKAAREGGYRRDECLALAGLGELAIAGGQPQTALRHLQAALVIANELAQPYDRANLERLIGKARMALGQADEAQRNFDSALAAERRLGDRFGEVQTLADLAALDETAGRVERSLVRLNEAMDVIDNTRASLAEPGLRAAYLASQRSVYERSAALLMRMDAKTPGAGFDRQAFEASERAHARALLDVLGKTANEADRRSDPALYAEARALDSALHAAAVQAKSAREDRRIAELLAQRNQIELRLRQKSANTSETNASAPLNLDVIRARLVGGNVVLLEYLTGSHQSHLWVVTPDELRHYALPPEAELQSATRRLYDALTERNRRGAGTAAESDRKITAEAAGLARALLPMPASMLAGKSVVLVVDGPLQLAPFSLLLPESARLTDAPSASVLARLHTGTGRRTSPRVLVLADPVYSSADARVDAAHRTTDAVPPRDSNSPLLRSANDFDSGAFERLRMSRAEADQIARLMPPGSVTTLIGFDAAPSALRRPDLDRFSVIHVAAHTLLDNLHPELSGLVLSLVDRQGRSRDGFVRLFDIYEMRLRSDLVVLSACETSIGPTTRGEGMIGLSRGFLAAGSRRVLASLWKVDDRATSEFMRHFYSALLQRNATAAGALASARKAMRSDPAWKSPYYWAAFVLQGDF